jgi:hypothetical protein
MSNPGHMDRRVTGTDLFCNGSYRHLDRTRKHRRNPTVGRGCKQKERLEKERVVDAEWKGRR